MGCDGASILQVSWLVLGRVYVCGCIFSVFFVRARNVRIPCLYSCLCVSVDVFDFSVRRPRCLEAWSSHITEGVPDPARMFVQ
jgi:hypothetical protein